MKKLLLAILTITIIILSGCTNIHAIQVPNETTTEQITTEELSTKPTEIIQMTSLEAEVEKMQHIIFATALSACEYKDNCNMYNDSLIWNSVYNYFLITKKTLNNIPVETIGYIFMGLYGKEGISDETSFDKQLVKFNRTNVTYDFIESDEINATYYIQNYSFDKNADIVVRINIFDENEEMLGSFDFILTKTKVITHIDGVKYKYKIKSFEFIN